MGSRARRAALRIWWRLRLALYRHHSPKFLSKLHFSVKKGCAKWCAKWLTTWDCGGKGQVRHVRFGELWDLGSASAKKGPLSPRARFLPFWWKVPRSALWGWRGKYKGGCTPKGLKKIVVN
jgi:hypothetical protein